VRKTNDIWSVQRSGQNAVPRSSSNCQMLQSLTHFTGPLLVLVLCVYVCLLLGNTELVNRGAGVVSSVLRQCLSTCWQHFGKIKERNPSDLHALTFPISNGCLCERAAQGNNLRAKEASAVLPQLPSQAANFPSQQIRLANGGLCPPSRQSPTTPGAPVWFGLRQL